MAVTFGCVLFIVITVSLSYFTELNFWMSLLIVTSITLLIPAYMHRKSIRDFVSHQRQKFDAMRDRKVAKKAPSEPEKADSISNEDPEENKSAKADNNSEPHYHQNSDKFEVSGSKTTPSQDPEDDKKNSNKDRDELLEIQRLQLQATLDNNQLLREAQLERDEARRRKEISQQDDRESVDQKFIKPIDRLPKSLREKVPFPDEQVATLQKSWLNLVIPTMLTASPIIFVLFTGYFWIELVFVWIVLVLISTLLVIVHRRYLVVLSIYGAHEYKGFLSTKNNLITYDQMSNVELDHPFQGKIFGYFNIELGTAEEDQTLRLMKLLSGGVKRANYVQRQFDRRRGNRKKR